LGPSSHCTAAWPKKEGAGEEEKKEEKKRRRKAEAEAICIFPLPIGWPRLHLPSGIMGQSTSSLELENVPVEILQRVLAHLTWAERGRLFAVNRYLM
jgi:hypothetical protein